MNRMTQADLERLANLYKTARARVLKTILESRGVGTKVYYNSILESLTQEIAKLEKTTSGFITTAIPREYAAGLQSTYAYFHKNGLRMRRPDLWASVHVDAMYDLTREMGHSIRSGLVQAGRRVMRYVDAARGEALRQAGLQEAALKFASGGTITDMRNALLADLQSKGFMTVQYGEAETAAQMPLDAYALMVARTTTREAGNLARENQLRENGYDLVKMTTHYPTCELCAPLQGRIFSIGGQDERFPPLHGTAFPGPYQTVHPNCRHSFVPWIEEMHSAEEVREAVARGKAPLEDHRNKQEIALYQEQQAKMRQARQDLYQYERYQQRLGAMAPNSFQEFLRLKYRDKEKFASLARVYRDKAATQRGPNFLEIEAPEAIPSWALKHHKRWDEATTQAVTRYTGADFFEINRPLREGRDPPGRFMEDSVRLQVATSQSRMEEDVVLWRGTGYQSFGVGAVGWMRSLPKEQWANRILKDEGFCSVSLLKTASFYEGSKVRMKIYAPKGALGAYVQPKSWHPKEYEVLLPPGASFKILEAESLGGDKVALTLLLLVD